MDAELQNELTDVKQTIRSLVISSPTPMDCRALQRDFRTMMGEHIPFRKFGYSSLLAFLKECCSDCFVFSGDPCNPELVPIVTEKTKHINDLISKQKIAPCAKHKGKRRSILETQIHPSTQERPVSRQPAINESASDDGWNIHCYTKENTRKPIDTKANSSNTETECNWRPIVKKCDDPISVNNTKNCLKTQKTVSTESLGAITKKAIAGEPIKRPIVKILDKTEYQSSPILTSLVNRTDNLSMKCRMSVTYFYTVESHLKELVNEHPDGLWLQDLLKLYKEKFEHDLDYEQLGYASLAAMCRDMSDTLRVENSDEPGQLVVVSAAKPAGPARQSPSRRAYPRRASSLHEISGSSDDALPGVPYDEGIFPEDCMGHREPISGLSLLDLTVGEMYEVNVSEVLDPSHFWFQLRGDEHDLALERLMNDMTDYYTNGEGRDRVMEFGAVQVGQYCATRFKKEGWHRSILVEIEPDIVKVRHVDYGTVDTVPRRELRVLLRRWAALPRQALRGSLAWLRPGYGASCWMYRMAVRFLELVNDKPLVAKIHSIHYENEVANLSLVDTNSDVDVYINKVLVMERLADLDWDKELAKDFLLPSFDDLENGRALNLAEKSELRAEGVFVEIIDTPFSLPVVVRTPYRLEEATNERATSKYCSPKSYSDCSDGATMTSSQTLTPNTMGDVCARRHTPTPGLLTLSGVTPRSKPIFASIEREIARRNSLTHQETQAEEDSESSQDSASLSFNSVEQGNYGSSEPIQQTETEECSRTDSESPVEIFPYRKGIPLGLLASLRRKSFKYFKFCEPATSEPSYPPYVETAPAYSQLPMGCNPGKAQSNTVHAPNYVQPPREYAPPYNQPSMEYSPGKAQPITVHATNYVQHPMENAPTYFQPYRQNEQMYFQPSGELPTYFEPYREFTPTFSQPSRELTPAYFHPSRDCFSGLFPPPMPYPPGLFPSIRAPRQHIPIHREINLQHVQSETEAASGYFH